jgi:ankyrin repeat protein
LDLGLSGTTLRGSIAGFKAKHLSNDYPTSWDYTSSGGQTEIIKHLIAAGAEENARGEQGKTPLHLADDFNAETVKILRQAGARM